MLKLGGKKEPLEQPNSNKILSPALTTTSRVAVGVGLVIPILGGVSRNYTRRFAKSKL